MKKTEEKVFKFSDGKNLISAGDRILVALSGGPDSVFLLHFLLKFRKRFKIELAAVHINHSMRGKNSDADEEFCRDLCKNNGVLFFSSRKDVKKIAAAGKVSLEEAGRNVRYSEFERIAAKNNFNKIATAHNCSDNAETVFLNLVKGAGLSGLSGIPVTRENIIRPVLVLTKNEILEYLEKEQISYRVDESNLESEFERNFIRNKIFPLVREKLNPAFEQKIFQNSEILRDISGIYGNIKSAAVDEACSFRGGRLTVNLKKLKSFDEILYKDIFKTAVEKYFYISLSFKNLNDIAGLIAKETGSEIAVPGKLIALRERGSVIFLEKKESKDNTETKLAIGGSVKIGRKQISIREEHQVPTGFSGDRKREYISGDKLSGGFTLRKWTAGDRFYPLGLRGSKKLSDFLNEQKISSLDKRNQLVLTNGGRIVWVVGLRLDERFKIKNNTNRILELCLK